MQKKYGDNKERQVFYMQDSEWFKELAVKMTVCDVKGNLVDMNDLSEKFYEKRGGRSLIGKNMMDCHPDASKAVLKEMLESPGIRYRYMEKGGLKKIIYYAPWYRDGEFMGVVSMSMAFPEDGEIK